MSVLNLSVESQNAILNIFKSLIDSDKKPAYLEIRQGNMPSKVEDTVSEEDILGVVFFTYPSAYEADAGALIFQFEKNQVATKSGKASWARAYTNKGKSLFDLDIGKKGQDAVLTLNSTDIIEDGVILIKKMVFMLH